MGLFLRALPLALASAGGVLCAHSLPANLDGFDAGVLDRDLTDADYQPPRGASASTPLPPPPALQLAGSVPVRLPWSPRDRALAVGFVTTLLIDAAQTRRLARGGWRDYEETNLILGRNPSEGRVNTYTAVAGLAVLGVAAAAPKRVRPWVLGVAMAVEVYALAAMSQRGVAIRF